jgi:hypothetical protein
MEMALLETSLPKDSDHQTQDRSKLARCLRSCFLHALSTHPKKEVFNLPFFGVQTFGKSLRFLHHLLSIGMKIKIFQLDHQFQNGACFFTLFEESISRNGNWQESVMRIAAALITLKVSFLIGMLTAEQTLGCK